MILRAVGICKASNVFDGVNEKRINDALKRSEIISDKNLATKFTPVTGSEDMQMLVHGMDDVKIAYDFMGTADPKLVAAAKAKGDEFPFTNHQPTYQVDLNAILIGAKVAGVMVMELMAKQ